MFHTLFCSWTRICEEVHGSIAQEYLMTNEGLHFQHLCGHKIELIDK